MLVKKYLPVFTTNVFRLYQSSAGKASLAVIIASAFNALMNIVVVALVGRHLGPENFSTYTTSLAIGGSMSLTIGGFQIAIAHSTAENASTVPAKRWTLNRTLLNPFVGVGALLGILWFPLSVLTSHLVGIDQLTVASLAVVLPISAAVSVVDGALFGLARFKTVQVLTVVNTISKLLFVGFYLNFIRSSQFLPIVIYLSAVPTIFIGSIIIRNNAFSLPSLKSGKLWSANFVFLLMWICLHLDLLITRRTLTNHDAGLYASCATIGKAMTSIAMLISFYAIPKSVVNMHSEQSTRRIFSRTAFAAIILGLLVTIATVSTNLILQIFGSQFETARFFQAAVLISYIPWACFIAMGQLRISRNPNTFIGVLLVLVFVQTLLLGHASTLSDIPLIMFAVGTLGALSVYLLPVMES